MAFRHRQVNPQTNDIIDVEDINGNNREFINELNGFIDRDNIPYGSIGSRRLEKYAFNQIKFHRITDVTPLHSRKNDDGSKADAPIGTDKTCIISANLTGWQNKSHNKNNQMLNVVNFEANTDGVLICEWSGSFRFGYPLTVSESAGVNHNIPQVIEFRILVNGIEITKLTRIPDCPSGNSGAMYGCIPVPSGEVKVMVEARTFKVSGSEISAASENVTSSRRDVWIGTRELICNFRKR